jgi:large subunit ribosomal protein L30
MAKLKITLVKSISGRVKAQESVARALGLRKVGQTVEQEDNVVIRGMIAKVAHLVKVEEQQ